jgi:hypothetical protein
MEPGRVQHPAHVWSTVRDGKDRVIRNPIGFESERLGMLRDHSWVGPCVW